MTSKAFKCLPDVKLAIAELTKLKAVGPATASGDMKKFPLQISNLYLVGNRMNASEIMDLHITSKYITSSVNP